MFVCLPQPHMTSQMIMGLVSLLNITEVSKLQIINYVNCETYAVFLFFIKILKSKFLIVI